MASALAAGLYSSILRGLTGITDPSLYNDTSASLTLVNYNNCLLGLQIISICIYVYTYISFFFFFLPFSLTEYPIGIEATIISSSDFAPLQ